MSSTSLQFALISAFLIAGCSDREDPSTDETTRDEIKQAQEPERQHAQKDVAPERNTSSQAPDTNAPNRTFRDLPVNSPELKGFMDSYVQTIFNRCLKRVDDHKLVVLVYHGSDQRRNRFKFEPRFTLIEAQDLRLIFNPDFSNADRLNGIDYKASIGLYAPAFRARGLYPKEDNEWSKWTDIGQVAPPGVAILKDGTWQIEFGGPNTGELVPQTLRTLVHPDRFKSSQSPTKILKVFEFPDQPKIIVSNVDVEIVGTSTKKLWYGSMISIIHGRMDSGYQLVIGPITLTHLSRDQFEEIYATLTNAIEEWRFKYQFYPLYTHIVPESERPTAAKKLSEAIRPDAAETNTQGSAARQNGKRDVGGGSAQELWNKYLEAIRVGDGPSAVALVYAATDDQKRFANLLGATAVYTGSMLAAIEKARTKFGANVDLGMLTGFEMAFAHYSKAKIVVTGDVATGGQWPMRRIDGAWYFVMPDALMAARTEVERNTLAQWSLQVRLMMPFVAVKHSKSLRKT